MAADSCFVSLRTVWVEATTATAATVLERRALEGARTVVFFGFAVFVARIAGGSLCVVVEAFWASNNSLARAAVSRLVSLRSTVLGSAKLVAAGA